MALVDNRTQLQDSEDITHVDAASDADPQSDTTEAGFVIEGTTAMQFQVTNAQEFVSYDADSAGSAFSLDLSDSTIYIMIKDNLSETFANLGGQVVVSDGTNDTGYNAAGADVVGLPYEKRYHAFKIDVSVVVAAPGTVNVDFTEYNGSEASNDLTAVASIGYGSIHLAKGQGQIPNAWFDGIYYLANGSYAASITGGTTGTPETMTDLTGDDVTVGAGMFANPLGEAFYIFAPTEWGAATGNTAFAGTDEQWFYLGDNGGGIAIGANNFPMRLLGGTGTNIFRQTRVTNINVGTRCQFDMSDADFDELELEATSWVDFGAITMPVEDTSKFCNNSAFINGDQMNLSSLDMNGNTWNGSNDANGAILWGTVEEDQDKQINSTFVRSGVHNAVEIAPTGAGPFTYDVSGFVADGFASQDDVDAVEAEKVFFINPSTLSADININLSGSSAVNIGGGADTGIDGFSYRVVGSYTGTVTITQTVTLTATVSDTQDPPQPIEGVRVRFENQSTGALISQGTTNASGVYTDGAYNYTGDLAVTTKARLKGYKYFRTAGTIINTGLSAGVTLQDDKIVDLP
jgi:hypothetical protein